MSEVTSLFIRKECSFEELRKKLEFLLELNFVMAPSENKRIYSANSMGFFFELIEEHGLENEQNIDFEKYEFCLDIYTNKFPDSTESREFLCHLVKYLKIKLKKEYFIESTGVHNLQQLLD
ncbi:MAG: hypothetical protein OQK04_11285 [Kangiellaceae bacterium]|nr:hypothetical protein [Kangiellaceae bacterium]MCW8999287.1 hypothetical protein [Kangiellaceae bacterium]